MANRRVSELNELLSTQVDASDLFLITDISAIESKRIRASQLQAYALNGTASYAMRALTSSYAHQARSASWSPNTVSASYALSASYADWAKTASYVLSASYALSSSWADRSFYAVTASYALSSSVQLVISSGLATYANSASYLIYTNGFNNGTASAAISASWAGMTPSASFLIYAGTPNGTASFAFSSSFSSTASYTVTSSYLAFTPNTFNGSASYALTSSMSDLATFVRKPMPYGIYDATITSATESKIVSMSVAGMVGGLGLANTFFTVYGTVILPYTASSVLSGSLTLGIRDQATMMNTILDTTWVGFESVGLGLSSGSITVPFNLIGSQYITGSWTVFVSASSPAIRIDTRRTPRFRIDSQTTYLYIP